MQIVALIENSRVIGRILEHLGLWALLPTGGLSKDVAESVTKALA
jgi:hypothetical protein